MELSIWIAIAACLLACYCAACNIALKSFSRTRLADVLEAHGHAERLEAFLGRLAHHQLVTATLRTALSVTAVLATLYFIETRINRWPRFAEHLLAFVVAGGLLSIFVVAIPAAWARYQREGLIAWSIPLLRVMTFALYPLVSLLHLFDPMIRRVSGADLDKRDENELSDQVLTVVEDHESGHAVDDAQKEMLEAVFELPTTTAAEVMTPRTDMKGIEISSTLDEVKASVIAMGHSRIPVYQESLDHILGVLYVKDLIAYIGNGAADGFDLRRALRDPFMVPETKGVRELLAEFKGRKVHMAIVLDEYGGTAGVITIEDIIEEIVGDIQDEYEVPEDLPQFARLDDLTADVDARMHIDDFNDALEVELPEDDDYDTVGGFVFACLGHIPEAGECFDFEMLKFTVTDAERTKVKRVRVEKLEAVPNAAPGD